MLATIKSKILFLLFKYRNKKKIKIGKKCYVTKLIVEGNNSIATGVSLSCCKLGYGTYINRYSSLSYVKIGRYCSIADHVSVCIGCHPVHYVTTHPAFYYDTSAQIGFSYHKGTPLYKSIYKYPQGESYYQVVIGNDVWIGSHVIIMGGCKIGDGAVIAAGSVVTKDVEPYSIVGGVPARIIRMRFSKEIIDKLLLIKWWNKPLPEVISNYKSFTNIDDFFKNYG